MYPPFPVISIEGDAYECGLQHGSAAAARVAKIFLRRKIFDF